MTTKNQPSFLSILLLFSIGKKSSNYYFFLKKKKKRLSLTLQITTNDTQESSSSSIDITPILSYSLMAKSLRITIFSCQKNHQARRVNAIIVSYSIFKLRFWNKRQLKITLLCYRYYCYYLLFSYGENLQITIFP